MTVRVLVVDQGRQPHQIVSWQDGVGMVVRGAARVLEMYDDKVQDIALDLISSWDETKQFGETVIGWMLQCEADGDFVKVRIPAVVQLVSGLRSRPRVRLTRNNIMSRDGFTCQYCGYAGTPKQLNLDHVVPRGQGGTGRWENLVTSCIPCNDHKGNRTPEQADMTLCRQPKRPHSLPEIMFRLEVGKGNIPDAWASFCYWNVTLDEG